MPPPASGGRGLLILLTTALLTHGSTPVSAFEFPVFPDWESTPQSQVATGCALGDLDGDGLPDLVVANGNDIARQPVAVYRNLGGTFAATPTWTSSDNDYHGHCDLADVDGDGHLDCAAAVYLGPGGFDQPGYVKLYRGNGDGTFSSFPVWTSADDFYCFSVSFGDVDMDGRPDLGCTAGESYTRVQERFRVYRNVGGSLESSPYWQSADPRYALDCTWGDVNGDGILDLAFACESNPNDPETFGKEVYFGNGTTLEMTAGWVSEDGRDYSNTIALGDLNNDGWLDLAVADNNQLAGGTQYGRTKVYLNDGGGSLHAFPDWISNFNGYGSHVSFIDADADGDLDLAAGSWWGAVRLYENTGGVLPVDPTWQSATGSVIENIAWEDVDGDGVQLGLTEEFTGDGVRQHFVLSRRPARVESAVVDGVVLPVGNWFASRDQGWITLGTAPESGARVEVHFAASIDLDFVVSNWDQSVGNYLFLNGMDTTGLVDASVREDRLFRLSPNPSRGMVWIASHRAFPENGRIDVVDASGSRIRTLRNVAGESRLVWDGRDDAGRMAPSGSYWIRVGDAQGSSSRRVVLVR